MSHCDGRLFITNCAVVPLRLAAYGAILSFVFVCGVLFQMLIMWRGRQWSSFPLGAVFLFWLGRSSQFGRFVFAGRLSSSLGLFLFFLQCGSFLPGRPLSKSTRAIRIPHSWLATMPPPLPSEGISRLACFFLFFQNGHVPYGRHHFESGCKGQNRTHHTMDALE